MTVNNKTKTLIADFFFQNPIWAQIPKQPLILFKNTRAEVQYVCRKTGTICKIYLPETKA